MVVLFFDFLLLFAVVDEDLVGAVGAVLVGFQLLGGFVEGLVVGAGFGGGFGVGLVRGGGRGGSVIILGTCLMRVIILFNICINSTVTICPHSRRRALKPRHILVHLPRPPQRRLAVSRVIPIPILPPRRSLHPRRHPHPPSFLKRGRGDREFIRGSRGVRGFV